MMNRGYAQSRKVGDGIKRGEFRHRTVRRMLCLAGIPFQNGHGWGYHIEGRVNPRTGSDWHAPDEARRVVREVRETT